jgi:hypothetical protein
MAHEI